MKKALLFLLFLVAALQLHAEVRVGHGYIVVYRQNSVIDSIAVHGTYEITHSKVDLDGVEHDDFVTMVVTTADGEWHYLIDDDLNWTIPELRPWERITLTGDINLLTTGSDGRRRIVFNGTFPKKDANSKVYFKWQLTDSVYIHMANQEKSYKTYIEKQDDILPDSSRALFHTIEVEKKEEPLYVYYPGRNARDYNHVKIARTQVQTKVDDSEHIGYSGDCGSALAKYAKDSALAAQGIKEDNIYVFELQHHPAYFAFLTHNPRVPSVKLKSVTMVANKPISGTFEFNNTDGILLESVEEDKNDTITLMTPFFYDNGWKHTPRIYENCQDSTAAYMVAAPQRGNNGIDFKFIFNVEDTLSLIDTTFVKSYHLAQLKPNTFYTVNAEVPDTLFSIVDLGLGDIKYSFRNVEAFFERGPEKNYGGLFSYGEAKTKDSYEVGGLTHENYHGSPYLTEEFNSGYDVAYQRWGGCWRLMQVLEADTLLKKCTFKWWEYNGVEGVLITGPSGKRIFLPGNDNSSKYWAVNRNYTQDDLWKDSKTSWGIDRTYLKIPLLDMDKDKPQSSMLFMGKQEFYQPGFARGVIEYSNYLKSNTDYDGSLMLLRHKYEEEVKGTDRFAIVGMVRSARPWPSESTAVQLNETGFIFGTDSATLYYDYADETHNKMWSEYEYTDSTGAKRDSLFSKTEWRPVDGNHLMLKDGAKSVGAYADNEQDIRVELNSSDFLGYLDKDKKYYVREYFRILNKETGQLDIYYATKATPLSGFFPHTGNIRWQVGDEDATLNGYVVGISRDVVGKVGFVVTDSIVNEREYALPTLENGELWLSDPIVAGGDSGLVKNDMTFSHRIPKEKLSNKRYYFVRGVFVSFSDDGGKKDTTVMYAPEVKILHTLDTVDLQLGFKVANINVGAQYPEDRDSTYIWNNGPAIDPLITDIAGTEHDIVFRKWFGREGWCFTLPTTEQARAMKDTCEINTPRNDKNETGKRFYLDVKYMSGINAIRSYMPYTPSPGWYDHAYYWTSQRPTAGDNAYLMDYLGDLSNTGVGNKYWVRPVLQTNCKTLDGEIMFVSTDTLGRYFLPNYEDSTEIRFYGRQLGITPVMKGKYDVIERGFVLHDFKGGTVYDTPCAVMPDTTKKENIFNGLYSSLLTNEVRDTMRADKEYWYRAYVRVKKAGEADQYYYGKPKKIIPLTISVDSIGWEVHEKTARLFSFVDGVDFVKNRKTAVVGYVVGDSANIDKEPGHYEQLLTYYFNEGEELRNTRVLANNVKSPNYRCEMQVPIDTVYWVRAFITADGVTRYSEARQFGLDYVDLGVKDKKGQTLLWANIDVGSAYAEDNPDYYAIGEAYTKTYYEEVTYEEDAPRSVDYSCETDQQGNPVYHSHTTNSKQKLIDLPVPNTSKNHTYTVKFRGAEKEKYGEGYNCAGEMYWKAYSGTKNDAAYVNWGNDNPKFKNTSTYIENTKYGNLFVEPVAEEWEALRDQCDWKPEILFGVPGWRVSSRTNSNSIFLPLKGQSYSSHGHHCPYGDDQRDYMTWNTDTAHWHSAGFFHCSDGRVNSKDSIGVVSLSTSEKSIFDVPSSNDSWTLTWSEFYHGLTVRPIARYNYRITKKADKLRDDTLAWVATDTCYYLNNRTAVALQGSYRINYPLPAGDYEMGFVVGTSQDVTLDNKLFKADTTCHNNSQFFTVVDYNQDLESDKTYYYRFYVKIKDQAPFYADADTFHLGRHSTGAETKWRMYRNESHMTGSVEGVMKAEAAAGFEAGIIVSYNRDLKLGDPDLLVVKNLTTDLHTYEGGCRGGSFGFDYTMLKDTTHYFRTYVKYATGVVHYGDVNLFGYELLDLGLPSGKKWASINYGGNSPFNGTHTGPLSEHHGISNNEPYGSVYNGVGGLGSGGRNDVSHKGWNNVYRQPYTADAEELINNCTWERDTIWGIAGMTGTSKINGKTIFIRGTRSWYEYSDNIDYSLTTNYLRINDGSGYTKPDIIGTYNHSHGCHGDDFDRPVWESSHTLPNEGKDEILIRTDDAQVHPNVDYVSFWGSLIGITQQRWMGNPYTVPNTQYAGFIVGRDTLVTHDGVDQYKMTYDFKHEDVHKDSIYWYDRRNINLFMMDSTYWVRAYVKIDGAYYYGRSIKFVRQPNIITGDVDWAVGRQKATVYGSVKGFNNQLLGNADQNGNDLQDMNELSKNARVGFIVGYKHNVVIGDTITGDVDSVYCVRVNGQEQAVNGDFSLTVDYKKDTTYYYRAFVFYKDKYIYGETGRFGLEFIDMGFGRKGQEQNENVGIYWASINVGSRYAEDVSSQFTWGDTLSRYPYTFENYIYYKSTGDEEYNNLGNEIKGSPYDVAHHKWDYTWDEGEEYGGRGQLWSMPSEEDLQMLVDSCEWRDSTSRKFVPNEYGGYYANVEGYKVTSKKNGNWIFITKEKVPEWTIKGNHSDRDGPWEYTPLWSSTRAPRDRNAYGMESGTTNRLMKYHYRYHGHYVRPLAYINVRLDNGKKLSLTTERTSWVAGVDNATINGCILGLNDQTKATYGFVVGSTDQNLYAAGDNNHTQGVGVEEYEVQSNSSVNGLFSKSFPTENNRMYYYRVYAKIGDKYFYGNIKDFGIVMVDLGLPSRTKWANVNMGSWKPKDHGDYYGWGETTTKDVFTESGYKYYDSELAHYRDLSTNISANDTTDVANKFLRGLWRMAGDEEWNELITKCTWKKDTVAHVPGWRVWGINECASNSIFLPSNYYTVDERDTNSEYATSEEGDSHMVNHDDDITHFGYYWSSNRSASHKQAREVSFDIAVANQERPSILDNARWRGNAIRAVARPLIEGQDFYVRTESTDWRYAKDSVNFYSAVLNLPAGFKTGILIGTSATITKDNAVENILARPTKDGSGNYVATKEHCTWGNNEVIYYYRSYVMDNSDPAKYWYGDSKQFGFKPVDLGTENLTWANINVDAASPEEIGLNGVLTDKYATADPAYVEFGSLWRTPSESEKQLLLDEENYEWTLVDKYGTQIWKVTNVEDINKPEEQQRFFYLTSKDPSEWGYRAVMQSNVVLIDGKKIFLRTDSTNWRAGYSGSTLYATLVGGNEAIAGINDPEHGGRGFVIGTTPDVDATTPGALFSTDTQYSTSAFSATLPTLPLGTHYYRAYVKYNDTYYYAPDAKEVGIDFIDLGLPSGVKWANVNIGSTVASDLGDNFAWGETTTRTTFTEDNYKHHKTTGYTDIGADISSSAYDAATAKIEGTHMPTEAELQELMNNCTWTKETVNGVDGFIVSRNNKSIFLPLGNYWTATQNIADISKASALKEYVNNNQVTTKEQEAALRYLGKMIRPVTSYVTTTAPTAVAQTTATLNGMVNIESFEGAEVGFELSRSSAMASATTHVVTVSANGAYNYTATGLAEGNMYYYRAYVKMTVGNTTKTYRGAIKSFATKSTPGTTPTAIDLGLHVKWADRNVDANLPEQDGNYYAWGDLQTQLNYTAVTYRHATGSVSSYSMHNIGKNITASQWDIATIKFAGCWRMPTKAEMDELMNSCSWTWGTKEGVPGYWVENGLTHENIFLPAAGYRTGTNLNENDVNGRYWAGTTDSGSDSYAQALYFTPTNRYVGQGNDYRIRFEGLTIRPVYDTNGKLGDQDIFIRTDSISYASDRTSNTFYGTMLGLNENQEDLTQGFVVVWTDSDPDVLATAQANINDYTKFDLHQMAKANGPYSLSLTNEQLSQLTVGDRYWVRSYVEKGGVRKYGNAIEMHDYSFFTDSVKWGLSNPGHLYAHVKGVKNENLTVGFRYSNTATLESDGSLKEGTNITAEFSDGEHPEVFKGTIPTIKVKTYYYQAYTLYEGTYHYGEVKSFGAKVVDLGLPSDVKWVDMNLGADDEENPGDTYRWGDTVPNDESTYSVSDGFHYVGGTQYDAAHVRLGDKYRIASISNIEELLSECTWAFDVNGYRVTSKKNGNSIFLPIGKYWSSQKGNSGDSTHATALSVDGGNTRTILLELRNSGLLLRPTLNPAADVNGEDGNAGVGTIGGGIEGNE